MKWYDILSIIVEIGMLCIMPLFFFMAFLTVPFFIYTSTSFGGEQGYLEFKNNTIASITYSTSNIFDGLHNAVINNTWQPYVIISLPVIILWIIFLFNKAKKIIKEKKEEVIKETKDI